MAEIRTRHGWRGYRRLAHMTVIEQGADDRPGALSARRRARRFARRRFWGFVQAVGWILFGGMGLLSWIIVGLIAGFLAKFVMPGTRDEPGGFLGTMLLGIVGAVVGGWPACGGAAG